MGILFSIKINANEVNEIKLELPEHIKEMIRMDHIRNPNEPIGALFICKPYCEFYKEIISNDLEQIHLLKPNRPFKIHYLSRNDNLYDLLLSQEKNNHTRSEIFLAKESSLSEDQKKFNREEEKLNIQNNPFKWSIGFEGSLLGSQKYMEANSLNLNKLNTVTFPGASVEFDLNIIRNKKIDIPIIKWDTIISFGQNMSFNEKSMYDKSKKSHSMNTWARIAFPFTISSFHIGPVFEYYKQKTTFSVNEFTGYNTSWLHSLIGFQLWYKRFQLYGAMNLYTERISKDTYFSPPYTNDYLRLLLKYDLTRWQTSFFPIGISIYFENIFMKEVAPPSDNLTIEFKKFESTFKQWSTGINFRISNLKWGDSDW